jgi:two-component system, LytTR family, sensor histidine kinase NatK
LKQSLAALSKIYLLAFAILISFHAEAVFYMLGWNISFYLTGIISLIVCFLVGRKIKTGLYNSLGYKCNAVFMLIQFVLPLLYLFISPEYTYLVVMILAGGLEFLRKLADGRVSGLQRLIKQIESEQAATNETFKMVRSQRHDFLKHAAAIHYMLDNGQNKEAKEYLDSLVDVYEETNLSIKGETGVVAGILNQMYRKAVSEKIDVNYGLDVPISALPLKDQDIVALMGNILSNAIEAAHSWMAVNGERPSVAMQFYKRSGLFILTCTNSSVPIPVAILDCMFEKYGQTTKKGNHSGLGTKIIKDIVTKYNGYLDFTYKEEEFTIKIKIPAVIN